MKKVRKRVTAKKPAAKGKSKREPAKKRAAPTKALPTKKTAQKLASEHNAKIAAAKAEAVKRAEMEVVLESLLQNGRAMEYIRQNVSKKAEEVLCLLTEPKTDEQISAELDLKINTVRRILNILQGYGVTNYTTSKDDKGWLSFFWSINANKIGQFFEYLNNSGHEVSIVTDGCNDYFVCGDCYKENNLIFNFDSAYESGFRCACNKKLERIDKAAAERLAVAEVAREQRQLSVGAAAQNQ
jgi:transcription initiation factor IIE alpha subunit